MDKIEAKIDKLKSNTQDQTNHMVSDSRRQILKGAAAAPLLMTVISRPVMGAQCSPSAWVSGNLSNQGNEKPTCGGYSPGYWKTNQNDQWAATGYNPGTKKSGGMNNGTACNYNVDGTPFHSVFAGSKFGSTSMMHVMWLTSNEDQYQLGSHIVAALLNAASIPDYGMSVADVQDIYQQLDSAGYYQTSTGETMTAEAVVMFIQNTFN